MTKNKKARSLFRSIFGVETLVVSLTLLLVGGSTVKILYDSLYRDVVSRNNGIATSVATSMDEMLSRPIDVLKMIRTSLSTMSFDNHDRETLSNWLNKQNQVSGFFETIEVIDDQGKVLLTLPDKISEIGYDRSRADYYNAIKSGSVEYWSKPMMSAASKSPSVFIAIPFQNGVLAGNLDLSYITSLSHRFIAEFTKDISIAITDINGVYIVNRNLDLVNQRRIDPNVGLVRSLLAQQDFDARLNVDDTAMILSVNRLQSTGWYVSVYETTNHAMAILTYVLAIFLGILVLITFIFLLISGFLTRSLVKEIDSLTLLTRNVAEGVFGIFPKQNNYIEFERLAESFRTMMAKIEQRDRQLEDIAFHDGLTGLHNRNYLRKVLFPSWIEEPDAHFALINLDFDNFMNINDTFGHELGDALLIEFGRRLNEINGLKEEVIRLGGDEFMLVCDIVDGVDRLYEVVSQIKTMTQHPILMNDREIYLTVSVGISIYPNDGTDFDTLIRCCDMAMFDAKEKGRDAHVFFDAIMEASVNARMNLEQHLRPALERNEFSLVFQPQVSIDKKRIRGFEALLRWNNPVLGNVSPNEFIPVAEETRQILKIGAWVASEACRVIQQINTAFGAHYIMAINASPVELKEGGFVQQLIAIVEEHNVNPKWIEIEITENIPVNFLPDLTNTLTRLRAYGFSVSVDDFGTGYSSLSYLHHLPMDLLKVDRSFIANLSPSDNKMSMTEMILIMAHNIGVDTLAEGVETEQQAEILSTYGCDYMQGYYFAKPMRLVDLLDLLEEFRDFGPNKN